jgi:tripartite ATP-independent transporter DctM subunit
LLKAVWPIAAIFLIVFGGIYGGVFTPTEGAAVGAASALFAGLARGELDGSKIRECFYGAAETTGMIFLIFLGADMLNAALALSQMPAQLAQAVAASGWPPMVVIVAILLFYVLLGCVMDELSMIVLTIPILFPAVMALDIHGLDATAKAIWFGILVLCVVEVGLIAPPVGLNVYVVHSYARDVPMSETYRGVMPFLAADTVRIVLLVSFPAISLWLAKLLVP